MNILDALMNIKKYKTTVLPSTEYRGNKMNLQGDALEKYIRNIFAGINTEVSVEEKRKRIEETFSYIDTGGNRPPDLLLRGGEAIEVKKKAKKGGSLALNSSFPKDILYVDDPKITDECRNAEEWNEKNMLYCIGVIDNKENLLDSLLLIYGNLFCASKSTYTIVADKIKEGIEQIENVEFSDTKELGKVKNIDPLGFTDLRIRGMWNIKNPDQNIEDIEFVNTEKSNISALIPEEYYNNFLNKSEFENFCNNNGIEIVSEQVANPNNPATFLKCKKIEFEL